MKPGIYKKLAGVRISVMGVTVFLASLATVAGYLEQSKTPSRVGQMISLVIGPEELTLLGWLLFLFAVAFGYWWLNKRMEMLEGRYQALGGILTGTFAGEEQNVVDTLVEYREWAVHHLVNFAVKSDGDIGRWEERWDSWRQRVIELLRRVCTNAEVSRFDVMGTYTLVAFGDAYNDRHKHLLSMLERDLKELQTLINQYDDPTLRRERTTPRPY